MNPDPRLFKAAVVYAGCTVLLWHLWCPAAAVPAALAALLLLWASYNLPTNR